jgi:hypothetical protein
VVGKTPRILKDERKRLENIKLYCGCLPCLLMGHLDRHTTIEHVTENGRRVGVKSAQHANTVGLCMWHHFGVCDHGQQKPFMIGEYGASLALGRRLFENHFGDEVHVLIPVQNYLLDQLESDPWPEYSVSRKASIATRNQWIKLNAN